MLGNCKKKLFLYKALDFCIIIIIIILYKEKIIFTDLQIYFYFFIFGKYNFP